MTLVPEVNLAREAKICYLSIATITDYDVWANHPVTSAEIIEMLAKNVEKTKKLIAELVATIPAARNKCPCSKTLEGALV
jgi:5'-methylthioadenosine phosphorylase